MNEKKNFESGILVGKQPKIFFDYLAENDRIFHPTTELKFK